MIAWDKPYLAGSPGYDLVELPNSWSWSGGVDLELKTVHGCNNLWATQAAVMAIM